MMTLTDLREKIERQEARLAVIGLGYVGLAVAASFAGAGFDVLGVEKDLRKVEAINAGRSPIEGDEPGLAALVERVVRAGKLRATGDYGEVSRCDVVLICVETPVDDQRLPRYAALRAALHDLGRRLAPGALVIVESTLSPGTMDALVRPILEESSGRRLNEGFFLGHCPERVMPGKLLANLRAMSRVCGGSTPETAETMIALYRQVVQGELDATDCLTAELVKTMENAYRDVQIAFANEMALLCEDLGADVWRVRELVNKSPQRDMHLPGPGVGGHCIPKDPWLLIANATPGFPARLTTAARAVNDSMPLHVAELVRGALAQCGRDIAGARVAVLGYAYLENSDDTRNTPSAPLVAALRAAGAEVVIHDPYVAPYTGDWREAVRGADAVVVMVAHDEYRGIEPAELEAMLRTPVVVDGRGLLAGVQSDRVACRIVGQRTGLSGGTT